MRWVRILIAAAAFAMATRAAAELDLRRASVSHLPNGLTVIMLEDHSFPLVSVQMLYKSGSAAEVTGKTGLAHFLEHLAFRGSQNFPNAKATELIYDSGGEWHGYTAYDQTTYFATMPSDRLDLLLQIEADRMSRTVIDAASIDAEKGAVVTELHSYENDPASVLLDAVTRTAIQAHPYGSPMAGYVSDVLRLTADDAREYYVTHYAPGNAVLAIVGDFEPPQAQALLARDFADVPAKIVAKPTYTAELPQRGQRRIELSGPVDRQYFVLAFPSPAASSPDFPTFLLLQEILSGGGGLNLHRSDWTGTGAAEGSLLFGAADDIASFLPSTRDPFLFTISGSIAAKADRVRLERGLASRIAAIVRRPVTAARLAQARSAVVRQLADDVQTTEDAAHQLAFFEGLGALDALLDMPHRIAVVTPADVQRVAKSYLRTDTSTVGWMVPGPSPSTRPGASDPRQAADRPGVPPASRATGGPELRHLSGGLPAIVQRNPLSNAVTVELLVLGAAQHGTHPADLPGLDAVVRSGPPLELGTLVSDSLAAASEPMAKPEPLSQDPATRLEQLIAAQIGVLKAPPKPLAVIVSGNLEPGRAFDVLETKLGRTAPATLAKSPSTAGSPVRLVSERIKKPLSQGALGYVVEGPSPDSREALAWRMLLYVLTHDYSGRLGRSAISDKGLVYHIYSSVRTDGRRSWATLSTGVDPDKADAMEAEFGAQIARLATEPPTASELDAARNHLIGRDLTEAQSNPEIAAKLAKEFIEIKGLRSHKQLIELLQDITPADLVAAAPLFANGTMIRVDVEPRTP
jgi:predicted Zn-dependent peptidase